MPQARPSSNEPKITTLALASSVNDSDAAVPCVCASTGHSLTARMASTLLMALSISSRSATWPRGRASSTAAIVITGEVAAANAAAAAALATGAPNATSVRPTAPAATAASRALLAASHGLSISQRGRRRVPSSNTSAAIARSISGFQGSMSVRCKQAQHRRAGDRAHQQIAEQPRQAQALVQRAGQHQRRQHHQGQPEHGVGAAQPGQRAAQERDEPVGDLLGHWGHSAGWADGKRRHLAWQPAAGASQT